MTVICSQPEVSLPRSWKRLDRDLARAWRRAQAGQERRLMSELRLRADGLVTEAVLSDGVTRSTSGLQLGFADGYRVRLGSCHRGAAREIAGVLDAGGQVRLVRVQRPGRIWYVEFSGPRGVLPIFAGTAATAGPGHGGLLVAA